MTTDRHRCDDSCACPIHGTRMLYAAATAQHACQDPGCVHAHGVDLVALQYAEMVKAEAERGALPHSLWHGNWTPPDLGAE